VIVLTTMQYVPIGTAVLIGLFLVWKLVRVLRPPTGGRPGAPGSGGTPGGGEGSGDGTELEP